VKLLGLLRRGLGWRGVGTRLRLSELAKRARTLEVEH
jgi:hypothetical protein